MKLFVAQLPHATDESELFALFSRYLDVASVKVVRGADGESRNFAFVELVSEGDVDRGLELDGYRFNGRAIHVQVARDKA